jgi:renal tumor antigen
MRKYRLIAKKGEGTFSEVLKAQNVKDSKYHAIKCMKNHFESIDQVNNLREIQALRRLSPHQHIVKLEEVLYDQPSGRLALVFELMDANLYEMIRGRRHYLKPELIQSLMYQLVKSLDHMHNKGIFHRDIKPENILVDENSKLKLADFGSCRGIYSKQPYTEYISTRWYRAPECLLTDGYYGPEMDMWGAGCVFFEITSLYPLFPGANELDQIHRIHKILGTPTPEVLELFKRRGAAHVDFNFPKDDGTTLAKLIPHASAAAIDLMYKMLSYDPSKRLNAREALRHEFFKDLREMEEAQQRASQQQQQQQQPQSQATISTGNQSGAISNAAPAAPPYGHQHLAMGIKTTKKAKDEYPESMPLPSLQQQSGKPHYADPNDYDDDDADQNELPPIHGGAGGAAAAKNKAKAAAIKLPQKPPKQSLAKGTNGSNTNRSGVYEGASNGSSSIMAKAKKQLPSNSSSVNSNSGAATYAKAKAKKPSGSSTLAGAAAGGYGYGYGADAVGGSKSRRK